MVQINNKYGFLTFLYEYSIFDNEPKKNLAEIADNVKNKIEYYKTFKAFPFMDYQTKLFLDDENEEKSASGILKFTLIAFNKHIIGCIDEIVSNGLEPDSYKKPNIIKSIIHDASYGFLAKPDTHTTTYLMLKEYYKSKARKFPKEKELLYSTARLLYE
mgnify:CR=1 FL=1